jgi:hypothetical protein
VLASPVDPTAVSIAVRFGGVAADTSLDPVGSSLRLGRSSPGAILTWADVGAPGYLVLRCLAGVDACEPSFHASTPMNTWTDPTIPPPGRMLWYLTKAANECAAGL